MNQSPDGLQPRMLFLHSKRTPGGWELQVTGDAASMHYQHEEHLNEAVGKGGTTQRLRPRPDKENYQGWCIWVLRQLEADDVVRKEAVDGIEKDLFEVA